jgi:hypothetical protein
MRRILLVSVLLCVLVPTVVVAWNFDYQIRTKRGGILENTPAYKGPLTGGGSGWIWFELYTPGWPDTTDPTARFNYIWQTYFAPNYDSSTPGAYKWVGQLPGQFYLHTTSAPIGYNGWFLGSINAKITVRDFNENGTLELWEATKQQLFDGRLSKLCTDPGGDEMDCKWGWGALASNYFSFFPPDPPGVDTLYDGGNLTLTATGCASSAEPASWGAIKALYRSRPA